MHHVLLRSRFDILVAHRLDCFLLRTQLVLENLKLDTIFRNLVLLFVEGPAKLTHFILDPLFVRLEEADFLRVQLIVLTLVFYRLGSPVEHFFRHVELFDLLLQLIVQVHDLGLLLFELRLSLLEDPFLGG